MSVNVRDQQIARSRYPSKGCRSRCHPRRIEIDREANPRFEKQRRLLRATRSPRESGCGSWEDLSERNAGVADDTRACTRRLQCPDRRQWSAAGHVGDPNGGLHAPRRPMKRHRIPSRKPQHEAKGVAGMMRGDRRLAVPVRRARLRLIGALKTSDPAPITLKLGCRSTRRRDAARGKRYGYDARAWEMRTDDGMWLCAPRDGHVSASGLMKEREPSPAEWSEAVRGWLRNALLASQDRDRCVTMHAATVALTASDGGILLAGDSYAGKSSIAADCTDREHSGGRRHGAHRARQRWLAAEPELTNPTPASRLDRTAITVRNRRLKQPARLRSVYQTDSRAEHRAMPRSVPWKGTEHAEVLLLRHADRQDTLTIGHAWSRHGPTGWNVARPARWSAEQTTAAILEHATSDAGMQGRRRVRSAA